MKIGFIGCGNMGSAMIGGILKKGVFAKDDIETRYLEEIRQNINFKKWFFGHYHDNQNVTEKEILLYEQVIRIA